MKVLLFNGSPHKNGCTFTALSEIAKTLEAEGIEAEILQAGNGPLRAKVFAAFSKGCAGDLQSGGKYDRIIRI